MSGAWGWYKKCLQLHPFKTQIITSGLLWGAGDVLAQALSRDTTANKHLIVPHQDADDKFKIDWRRAATTSLFGFGFVGPVGHAWYEGLDHLIRGRFRFQPKSFRFVASKVVLDGAIFGPLYILTFFSYMGLASGKTITMVKEDVKRDFIPAFGIGVVFGPLFQAVNFRYIPVRYQLTIVNSFCLLDSAFLSWIDQQEDAPWKKWLASLVGLEEKEEDLRDEKEE